MLVREQANLDLSPRGDQASPLDGTVSPLRAVSGKKGSRELNA